MRSLLFIPLAVLGLVMQTGVPATALAEVTPEASYEMSYVQARPARPRPVQRPVRPVRQQPTRPVQSQRLSVDQLDRLELERIEAIEREAEKLVERTRRSLARNKNPERLIRKLERDYRLTFVQIEGRHTLVRHREVVGINLGINDLTAIRDLGFQLYRSTMLPEIGVRLELLLVPEDVPMEGLQALLKEKGASGMFVFNPVFTPVGRQEEKVNEAPDNTADNPTSNEVAVGMVDTGVYQKHKRLEHCSINQKNFGRGEQVTPRNHGTAVASILAGQGVCTLLVADVYSGPILFADAEAITLAMEWLAGRQIGVINMSLAGPPELLLELAVHRLNKSGHAIVAAVGNNGPVGESLYPASYDRVIGVTAVDSRFSIYKHAYQGSSVDYAAQGVKLKAAALRGTKKYSGTSFAAPAVAGMLAQQHPKAMPNQLPLLVEYLNSRVEDLGEPGRDPVFGMGLLRLADE